jgi:fibro-slime domain-containing protein
VWIFINGHLVIDLGGVHAPLNGEVTLSSAREGALGLVVGQAATLDIFQAERHITGSSYSLTLENLTP